MTPSTRDATAWWLQHAEHQQEPWAEKYWEDWKAPHRSHILLALSMLPSLPGSLFEIGCNAGPNLRLIREHCPEMVLSGQELCKIAADFCSAQLSIPVQTGTLSETLFHIPDKSVDAVLSCYTMAYLDKSDALVTMRRLIEIARDVVIIAEPLVLGPLPIGQCRFDGLPEWRHDYDNMIPWRVAWKWPIIPPVQNLNGIAVYRPN